MCSTNPTGCEQLPRGAPNSRMELRTEWISTEKPKTTGSILGKPLGWEMT